ncbi:helix-turn-helix domain-containing protein [Actinocorallia sp. B10E7]|uniref:helix-turn-helix domain-containing protein n=1 Tax=Actinocorallia sp. B10E7 TaxID=3153558 RepID=UPI00325CDBD8
MDQTDLLLHPVRLRIVHALSGGRSRTTAELGAHLADVPKTSVYRHVAVLADAGVLEVAGEQRVRGAVERTYRLRGEQTPLDGAAMTIEDHRRGFTAAMAALLAEFNAYLGEQGADPSSDGVGYRQGVVWLTPQELADLTRELLAVLASRTANTPAPGRVPHLMSLILFPTGRPTPNTER